MDAIKFAQFGGLSLQFATYNDVEDLIPMVHDTLIAWSNVFYLGGMYVGAMKMWFRNEGARGG